MAILAFKKWGAKLGPTKIVGGQY